MEGSGRWRVVEHPGELVLELEGATWDGLLGAAVRGFGEVAARGVVVGEEGGERRVELGATDRAALLVDLLNELVYLADAERWLGVGVEAMEAGADWLEARVRGRRLEAPATFVKAATLHGATVTEDGGTWRARVVLDI